MYSGDIENPNNEEETVMDSSSSHTVGRKVSYGFSILGGILLSALSIYGALHTLSELGLDSVLHELNLSGSIKVTISLSMFLGFSGATLAFIGAYLLRKGYTRASVVSNYTGAAVALSTFTIPPPAGITSSTVLTWGTVISAMLIAAGAVPSMRTPSVAQPRTPLLSSVEVATVAILSAMYAIAILLIVVPSPTGGYTHIGDIVVFIAALLFGYRVGGLVGMIGSVVADLYTGYSRWYISILAHGLEGVVAGLARGRRRVVQVVMCIIGGVLMASTYFLINIFIKGVPLAVISYAQDLFAQAGVSIVLGIAIVTVVQRVLPQFRQ
jgi:uncharacterized membrane protein